MALFMVEWTSLDPKVTTSLFASGVLNFGKPASSGDEPLVDDLYEVAIPESIKLQVSVHVVGQPMGFVLLQASPEEIHQLILAIPPDTMELTVYPVVDDAAAKQAMSTRSSGYKLK